MASEIVDELRVVVDGAWARLSAQLQGMGSYLERSDAPGEWTARQVLCHLLSEPGWRPLPVLFAFSATDPPIIEFTPGRAHVTPERVMMQLPQFTKALDRHRREVFEYLDTLSDEALRDRKAVLAGVELTIPAWVRRWLVTHWIDHAGQLAKIRKAAGLPEAVELVAAR
jgi:DinB superfamily